MEESSDYIKLYLCPGAVRTLLYAVNTAIRDWPGGDPGLQQNLLALQTTLQAASLESLFDSD